MENHWRRTLAIVRSCLPILGVLAGGGAVAQPEVGAAYHVIVPSMAGRTVTLTGHDLTVDELVEIARFGAKVNLSPEARRRAADAYGLLLEGAAEGVPIYGFNRGSGAQREVSMFKGDPFAPGNEPGQRRRQQSRFEDEGPSSGYGPEISDEEVVRATMAVRLNTLSYEAASPEIIQSLQDLLNHRITPIVQSRGSIGEGDLEQLHNVAGAMIGAGSVYFQGVRMSAGQALARAGLKPYKPAANDDFRSLTSTDAYAIGQSALLIADGRRALDWADLIYAMDLNGMNSSVTPLSKPVQDARPIGWLRWDADRVLGMIKGSYLLDADPGRIIQDPESLRASSVRQGSAWSAWANLRDTVLIQMNSSDHNPAVRVDASPKDSWELSTPQFMKFYVKGGRYSDGKHGFILSTANWDPYPLSNQVEAFTNALANMDVAILLRIQRFTNPFFTIIRPADMLPAINVPAARGYAPPANEKVTTDIWQDISGLQAPVAPEGQAIEATVEDLQAQSRFKLARARQAVSDTVDLLGQDLLTATYWMDLRRLQSPSRAFGAAPTAAWRAFREIMPFRRDPAAPFDRPPGAVAAAFLNGTPAASFCPPGQGGCAPPDVHATGPGP